MTHPLHRLLAAATLAALLLLSAVPGVAAAPAEVTPLDLRPQLPAWLSWISPAWLAHQDAAQEAFPNMDPDGAHATPTPPVAPGPDDQATQAAADDGDAFPNMDPNG